MQINRTFWVRQKGSIEQAFSYAKDTTAINFAKKYGGSVQKSLPLKVEDNLLDLIQDGEVYSILKNSEPVVKESNDSGEFSVLRRSANEGWVHHAYFDTISDANTEAKDIISNYEAVLVIRHSE